MISYLLSTYSTPPIRLGDIDAITVVNEGGLRMADVSSIGSPTEMGEVIVATAADVGKMVAICIKIDEFCI